MGTVAAGCDNIVGRESRMSNVALVGAVTAVLLAGCTGGQSAESIAGWACERVVDRGADPGETMAGALESARDSGVSEDALGRALAETCGVELGLVP